MAVAAGGEEVCRAADPGLANVPEAAGGRGAEGRGVGGQSREAGGQDPGGPGAGGDAETVLEAGVVPECHIMVGCKNFVKKKIVFVCIINHLSYRFHC